MRVMRIIENVAPLKGGELQNLQGRSINTPLALWKHEAEVEESIERFSICSPGFLDSRLSNRRYI